MDTDTDTDVEVAGEIAPLYVTVMGDCAIRATTGTTTTPAPGARALLTILVARSGAPVGVDELRRALWVSPPDSAVSLIRGYVRDLRRALGPHAAVLETIHAPRGHTGGYRLAILPTASDCGRFRKFAAYGDLAAHEGRQLTALAWWSEALTAWSGHPAPHLVAPPRLAAIAHRWHQARHRLVERYAATAVVAGVPDRAAAEIATLHHLHPDRPETARLYREICPEPAPRA